MTEYKAISLFSGLGGDSLGMTQAGCKIIAYNELKPAFCKSHDANFPDSELICEGNVQDISKLKDDCFVKYDGKTDILFAGFPCFIRGTLVLTNNGYKEIQKVLIEDKLLTHTGKFQKLVNLQRKEYNGILFDIKLTCHPELITCTEEHPFYVREKTRIWNNSLKKYECLYGEPKWKKASSITINDTFGMVINSKEDVPTFVFDRIINKSRMDIAVKTITLDNPDQWFTMGYFVGNGWLQDDIIRFDFYEDDTETFDRIKKVLNITYKDIFGKSDNGCDDFVWFNILKQFGKYAYGKWIPEWVQNAPTNLIQEFINGYMTTTKIGTASYNIAYGIQRLYLKLGKIASIYKTFHSKVNVNQRDMYQITIYPDSQSIFSTFIEGNYVWYTLFKITTRETYNEPVYNFEVEQDNSYIVFNAIAHNCQGFSNAGKKKEDDPRNTMFLEFLRATKLSRPKMIIGENVKGILSRKATNGEMYIDIIIAEFGKIGYNVIYKVFNCEEYGVPQKRERLIIIGIKKENQYGWNLSFPEPFTTNPNPNLISIVKYNMTGAVKVESEWFRDIPVECILTDMTDTTAYKSNNGGHPYLVSQIVANGDDCFYDGKQHEYLFSFGKRNSPIHCEIIDIRKPSKTIICTYEHQPRLFVPLKNESGCYLRMLLPDELKQIQGFPADYIVCGSDKEKIIQIGNAVPPPLIKAIVKHVCNK